MPHPAAVLRFVSPKQATRLCCDYETPYGEFIRDLFEFVWMTPNVNAAVTVRKQGRPVCVALRYTYDRPEESLGKILLFRGCNQDTELIRQLEFSHSRQDIEVRRSFRYMKTYRGYTGPSKWATGYYRFYSYSSALADTILDYKCLITAPTPADSFWSPPPEAPRGSP